MASDKPLRQDKAEHDEQDSQGLSRRSFLTAATGMVGSIGAATFAWPFISSMNPSAQAKTAGAPVSVDLARIGEGELILEKWRGKPIWIVRRTKSMLAELDRQGHLGKLRDPDSEVPQQPGYAKNAYRSIKPEYLVLVGICTHLGCSPSFRPDIAPEDLGASWRGGFFCACHGSRFDLAGRVYKSVPAPKNLEVPPYRYVGGQQIVVGESGEEAS